MIKNTQIELEITDEGIKFKTANRRGLVFTEVSTFVPWGSIANIELLDNRKGPLKINTYTQGRILYWNIINHKENYELFDLIKKILSKNRSEV